MANNLIWFDTEFFEDGVTIRPISIGLVNGSGREYYAEFPLAERDAEMTPWLMENVRPHLRGLNKDYATIRNDIVAFAGDNPEFWGYFCAYDWVLLCQLFGSMMKLPKGWPMRCRDVAQFAEHVGVQTLPPQIGAEHDALNDARWTKVAWAYVMGEASQKGMLDIHR